MKWRNVILRLILNEKKLLNKSLDEGYIDDKKPTSTIGILAKYCLNNNMDTKQTIDFIDSFFKNNYLQYNYVKWIDTIERIVRNVYRSKDYELMQVDSVEITESELETIGALQNLKYEKLAFSLLVYAKIYNKINNNDRNWVNEQHKYIFSDAKLAVNVKEQGVMINGLKELGLVTPSTFNESTNINVNFVDKDSPVVLEITDFRNFVYEYLKWKGKNIIKCEECDLLIRQRNNRQKYCASCWEDQKRTLWKDASKKYRDKKKSS